MAQKILKLWRIVQDRRITAEEDREFLILLQKGLLLALGEGGFLTDAQVRAAEERLGRMDRGERKGERA